MIETQARLDALVRYAARKGRPLSLREYRYLRAYIRWKTEDRLLRGRLPLGVGFGAIILGGLALSVTPFALVLMLAGVLLNLLAAEKLDPKEVPHRQRLPRHLTHEERIAALDAIRASRSTA